MAAFRCDDAAATFGFPAAAVEDCRELLPGLWRVVLSGGGVPHGSDVFRGAWVGAERVAPGGVAAFSRWARGVALYDAPSLEAWAVGQALETLAAFPPGFDSESVASVVDPLTGESGGVTRDPLTVVAYRLGYDAAVGASDTSPSGDGDEPEPAVGRATLRGTADYAFAWTVERREPGGAWTPVEAPPAH
ncbi:MAG: hypothetical protein U1F43_29390 [Myxococcota bacterium]